jgi:hypothetical protein
MAKKTKSPSDSDFITSDSDDLLLTISAQASSSATSSSSQPTSLAPPADDEFCPRQITFTIPGKVGVQVTATEHDGNIDFVVDALGAGHASADLRGLFMHFNEARLSGLTISGGDGFITETQIKANKVIDLGNGANMHGKADPFDIGIEFGTPGKGKDFVDGPIHFTLSDAAHDLTLDDFAHLQFGARLTSTGDKIVTLAPAAPKAEDDVIAAFEDGAPDMNSPSKTPTAISLDVLHNDHDADGDQLSIIGFHDGPQHGTIAVAADGKTVLYTPDLDFSGSDSFEYCVSDGHGGQDSARATVNIAAVADAPLMNVEVLPGEDVYHIVLNVTATQNDADGSEFIDQISASVAGGLPAGVTITPIGVNPGDQPGQIVQQFIVKLPEGQSTKFNLDLTATTQEKSNGDQEHTTVTKAIELEFHHNETVDTFQADNQSIWDNGDAFVFDQTKFLGIDIPTISTGEIPFFIPPDPIPFFGSAEGHLKAGFNAHVHFEAGDIDATVPLDITLDTAYNKTTDILKITPTVKLADGGHFSTTGPEGEFGLDFLIDAALDAGIDFPVDIHTGVSGSGTIPLFSFGSHDPALPYTVPLLPGIVDISFDWPHLSTNSSAGTLTSHNTSNDFLHLNVDVDAIAEESFPLLAPIDPDPLNPDNFELIDLDLNGGLNLIQNFVLNALGLKDSTITLENGDTRLFDWTNGLTLDHVSSIDGADADHNVNFSVNLTPDADLHNTTSVGVHIGGTFDVLKNIPGFGTPIPEVRVDVPIGSIDVYDNHFGLNFTSQDYQFMV